MRSPPQPVPCRCGRLIRHGVRRRLHRLGHAPAPPVRAVLQHGGRHRRTAAGSPGRAGCGRPRPQGRRVQREAQPRVDGDEIGAADIQARLVERRPRAPCRNPSGTRRSAAPPAGCGARRRRPSAKRRSAVQADRRAHVGQGLPARCDRVGPAGPRVEPHDAVVQQQARARPQQLAAERGQQRLRQRHEVALGGRPR